MNEFHDNVEIISKPTDMPFVEQWYELADLSHFWMVWRFRAFLNQCRSLNIPLHDKRHGIEIGCGHGVFRSQLEANTPWTIDGADLDLSSLKRNNKGRGRLLFYDILEKQGQFEEEYDFLFLFDVLEHIEHTAEFLDACMFMLKPNGLLFVNVPASKSLFSSYDTAAGHHRRYNTKSLATEFNLFKCKLLDIRYWGFSLFPVLMIRKFLLRKKLDPADIIRSGFKPPSSGLNSAFKTLMAIETALLKRPPLGTSVLAVVRKS